MKNRNILIKRIVLIIFVIVSLILVCIHNVQNIKSLDKNVITNAQIRNKLQKLEQDEYISMLDRLRVGIKEATVIDVTNLEDNESIGHQHLYKTNYDENKHWEECRVCGQKNNENIHSYTDNGWIYGSSCHWANVHKYSCSCGYSYTTNIGKPEHKIYRKNFDDAFNIRDCCDICGYTEVIHDCIKSDGSRISCKNPGVCMLCSYNYSTSKVCHYADVIARTDSADNNSGKYIYCHKCGIELGKINYSILTRESNNTYNYQVSINFTGGNKYSSMGTYDSLSGLHSVSNIKTINNSTSCILERRITYNEYLESGGLIHYNCYGMVNSTTRSNIVLYAFVDKLDNIEPVISSITMGNGGEELTEWSRTKPIVVSGIENYCKSVTVKIIDENENTIFEGKGSVNNPTDSNYAVSCIPELEVDTNGKTFKAIVTDACGNSTEKEFKIAKIDTIPPTPTSGTEILGEWAKSKDFTFSATDYGIGQVSIAFNDMEDLQLANVDGNTYSRDYTFIGDVYNPKQLSVLYKDGLENASIQKITIDKLDNTAPTITNANLSSNKLIVEAHDRHETLGEGSGILKYKYITSDTRLVTPEVTEDWVETSNNEILIEDVYKAKYIYVVAEDLVGNVSDVYEIVMPELILDTEVDLSLSDGKGGVNLDWTGYDPNNKVFKAYHRKDDVVDADWETILDNGNTTKFTDNLAQDVKAPDAPTMSAGQVGITKDIQISFNTKDNGSTYSFYVEAYDSVDTSIKLSVSNERTETVTTGTKGYYYIIDEDSSNKDFDITSSEVKYTTDENILIHIANNGKYIHMKADDVAGNVSEPSTYKIDLKKIDIDEEITIELTKTWIDNNIQRLRRPDKLRFVVIPVKDTKEGETISSNNVLEDNAILSKGDSVQKDSEEQKDEMLQGKIELDENVKKEPQTVRENKDSTSGEIQSSSLDEEKTKEENSQESLKSEGNKIEENQVETFKKENSILENIADENNKSQQTHEILDKSDKNINEKTVLENIVSKETIKSRMSMRLPEEKTSNNEFSNSLVGEKNTTNEVLNNGDDRVNNNIEKVENTVKSSELESLENVTNSNEMEVLDKENKTNKETNIKNDRVEDEILEDNENINSSIEGSNTDNSLETPKLDSTQVKNEITLEENEVSSEDVESYTYEFEVDKEVSSQTFNLAGILRYDQTTGKPMKYIIKEEEVNEGDLKFYETTVGEVEKIADSEGNIVKYTAEIINKFKLPENNTKDVKVTKIWNDDNQIAIRPTSVILELIGRVKDIQIIEETEIVEQQSDAEETIKTTETPKQENQTNEIISDNNNEVSYRNISSKEGTVSSESEWKHTYIGLPIYDENGQEIEYIAQEKEGQAALDKYISEVSKINELNEITVTNSLIIRNSIITKTGLEEITSIDSNVPYNIDYETELDNKYTENMVIEIVDTLPYEIDEEKSDLKGGEYNYNEGTKVATITWRGTYNPTSKRITWENVTEEKNNYEKTESQIKVQVTENAEKNTQILKVYFDMNVTYKNINVLNEKIVNKVSGKVTLSNNAEEKVESIFETRTKWIRNITVTKFWKGDTEETRPESIELQLSASIKDENNQHIEYVLNESIEKTKILSKDMGWTGTLWTNLPSYDESGKEIYYTVQEINIDGYKSEILEINKNCSDIEITIQNIKLYKLPITGGIGVDTIRSLEVLLGIIVLILLTNRKKIVPLRRTKENK